MKITVSWVEGAKLGGIAMFQRSISPPPSVSNWKPSKTPADADSKVSKLAAGFFFCLIIEPEVGGDVFLRNIIIS
jgi:hypothetical protein